MERRELYDVDSFSIEDILYEVGDTLDEIETDENYEGMDIYTSRIAGRGK